MTHRNAPLTVEGRRRLIERCQSRPIAHVAAEMGISRQCASKWVNRFKQFGDLGLQDRSSTPIHQPTATTAEIVAEIESMRRTRKWSASRITFELQMDGTVIARRTVTRILLNLGLHRRRFIDPNGENNRKPQVIVAKRPGQMVHVDIKKVGRIPDGGGWRVHGRGSEQAKRSQRRKTKNKQPRIGYTYLHSAIDGNTRLAYTEARDNETASTAIDFMNNARLFFAAHGITRIERVITDNGSCYRAADFTASLREARHYRIKPYTPKHNGKVERYNRILAEELLYSREYTSEQQRRTAVEVWNVRYNYHRPHSARGGRPPAAYRRHRVTNVRTSYI
ncbi:IS481 family transposase [Rhodococcus baikonurensis]|uniref:IS481 family transposase n=1 Tax=Rhodococcus baikonurensis TaxID=172041 RepID=UPI0037AC49FC